MLMICQIDWREVGVAFEMQCFRNCTLSSYLLMNVLTLTTGWNVAECRVEAASTQQHGVRNADDDIDELLKKILHLDSKYSCVLFCGWSVRSVE